MLYRCALILIANIIFSRAGATELLLLPSNSRPITININKSHVIAIDKDKNITYQVDRLILYSLIRSDDIQLVKNIQSSKENLFILSIRQPSHTKAMGQGYCGAGYEDYLILVEVLKTKLVFRDQILIQSCIKNISMFIDHGDDSPANGLTYEEDGSFSYRLVDDNVDKKRILSISEKHFKDRSAHVSDR